MNAVVAGSNRGVGRGIGTTTPVPSGGSGDCIDDESGATPGDRPVDGGGGTVACWASALPDSKANPSAAIEDLIMFIVLLPYVTTAEQRSKTCALELH